jgi:DNA excision repair protein ERCC-4
MNETQPTILIDTREQTPLPFAHFPTERATLPTGDYSAKGIEPSFCIERKSLADLVGSLTADRARFTRELERMRGYAFRRLLVIGSRNEIERHAYRSKATPASILGSLWAFEVRYGVPVVFAATPEEGAEQIERWAFYTLRERLKEADELRRLYLTG